MALLMAGGMNHIKVLLLMSPRGAMLESGHWLMGITVSWIMWVGSAWDEGPETGLFAGENPKQGCMR